MLVGAAISASHTKGSYLKDKFYRLKARRGSLRAALAIAHKILIAAYHMLAKGIPYRDLGEAYLDQIDQPVRPLTSSAGWNGSATSSKLKPKKAPAA
jgi:hypothetical protein